MESGPLTLLHSPENDVYLSAVETIQSVNGISKKLGLTPEEVAGILNGFEQKGLASSHPTESPTCPWRL